MCAPLLMVLASHSIRFDPYKRETTRITDLCNMLSAATASTLREDNVMEMEQDEAKAEHRSGDSASEGEHNNEEGKVETRGKILQRHKREWKSLRSKLHDMKAHKKAMGHGTLAKKDAKKDVAKEIKALEEAMRCAHCSHMPTMACAAHIQKHMYVCTSLRVDVCQKKANGARPVLMVIARVP